MQVRIAELEILPEWLDAYLEAAGAVGAESVAKEPGVAMNIRSQRYSARACNGNVPREVREGRKDDRRLSELGGLGVRQTCPVPSSPTNGVIPWTTRRTPRLRSRWEQ